VRLRVDCAHRQFGGGGLQEWYFQNDASKDNRGVPFVTNLVVAGARSTPTTCDGLVINNEYQCSGLRGSIPGHVEIPSPLLSP
jgi:hypothetical protein